MEPLKFPYCSQAVDISNKFPARKFKVVKWGSEWALAKGDGRLVELKDLK